MLDLACNIDKGDRINRTVFGAILILGALLGLGKFFLFLMGAIMVAEGLIGWCGVPYIITKLKLDEKFSFLKR